MNEIGESELNELQQGLIHLQSDLRKRLSLSASSSETVQLDQSKVGRVSRIDAIQQQSMAQSNRRNIENRLKKIQLAINKMEADDYGFCSECDEPIGFPRLKVQPESTLCLKCQSEMEQA